ncbi:putative transcription factor C2H2 family [Helianthus annuus]|uniref:RING-type E3 ubiquitin transferase n=1 Tax=Helianthus annuus TaxID=4232 RepID=A0A251SRV4_HELAN|nr:RING-H2 finger protein ATL57 [Helianthus annuus]KAF5773465.1 putative transcription factor C2H2 family [Helianthus annuus]KAJ0481308.1 putative transcription factor C2H2 family [Helianthus annuus]KAJ0497776.1 putative transcription factor C2H2 family [Helianthus annuus]KAJ0671272.1 putative transcription factor C2H2 family [Helianthus annuus]
MRTLLQEEDSDKLLRSPATSSPFDSSLVLTVLVLLTVLFFMAFFSLYIRRFSSVTDSGDSEAGNSTPRLHKRGGVDVSTVQSLPIVQYGGDLKTWNECSICLTEFEERETVKVIPYCRHGFHPVCIETWLSSHGSCPMCRSTQLFPAVDEVRTGTG